MCVAVCGCMTVWVVYDCVGGCMTVCVAVWVAVCGCMTVCVAV